MIEWPIAVFLLGLSLIQLFWTKPGSIRQKFKTFWSYCDRKQTPSKEITALIFVGICFVGFSFWESLLRVMLQSIPGLWVSVPGAFLMLSSLGLVASKLSKQEGTLDHEFSKELTLSLLGASLLIGAWISAVVLGPWFWFRARKAWIS